MTDEGHDFESHDEAPMVPEFAGKSPEATLRTALLVYAAFNAIVGILLLVFPRFFWDTIGGVEELYIASYDTTRLFGGALIALAVGALLVARNPRGQNTLVTVMVIEATLTAVGGFWTLFANDAPTNLPIEILLPVVTAAIAVYLGWARVKARKILSVDEG